MRIFLLLLISVASFGQSKYRSIIPTLGGVPSLSMPVYEGKGAWSSGTGAITLTQPSGITVGWMKIIMCETSTETVATPSGWTALTAVQYSTTTRLSLFYRYHESGDGSVNIADPGNHVIGVMMAFSGVGGIDFQVEQTWAGTTAFNLDCGVSTKDNVLVVAFVAGGADSGTSRYQFQGVNATLDSFGQRVSEGTVSGDGGSIDAWSGGKLTAGDCGNITSTLPIASAGAARVIGLYGL